MYREVIIILSILNLDIISIGGTGAKVFPMAELLSYDLKDRAAHGTGSPVRRCRLDFRISTFRFPSCDKIGSSIAPIDRVANPIVVERISTAITPKLRQSFP